MSDPIRDAHEFDPIAQLAEAISRELINVGAACEKAHSFDVAPYAGGLRSVYAEMAERLTDVLHNVIGNPNELQPFTRSAPFLAPAVLGVAQHQALAGWRQDFENAPATDAFETLKVIRVHNYHLSILKNAVTDPSSGFVWAAELWRPISNSADKPGAVT